MRNATSNLHYATWIDGEESQACVNLNALVDALPHGGGVDGNWYLTIKRNGTVDLAVEYHKMDENGFYCGWTTLRFSLRREMRDIRHDLSTPGFFQTLQKKGDVILRVVSGGEIAEEVACGMDYALTGIVSPMRQDHYGPNGSPATYNGQEWTEQK